MADLHLDVKSIDWHFEENKWRMKLTVYIGKGGERERAFDSSDALDYERIYIPMTLSRCLVVENGYLIQTMHPIGLDDENIEHQNILIGGKEFHLMSMQTYSEQRKKEKGVINN